MDFGKRGSFPVIFFAIGTGADPFKGQRTVNEHHFAVGLARHTLGLQIQRMHKQPVGLRMGRAGMAVHGQRRIRFGRWIDCWFSRHLELFCGGLPPE